jgi:mannose-6-phosphate isomerase-like protein (cupin superfamily)
MATIIGPNDGRMGKLGTIGVRFLLDGARTGGGFSLVEHPIPAHALGAPLHRHTNEDEYSFVLEGRVGMLLGDDVVTAGVGDLIVKPRAEWHTFWNPGDVPARILEIVSPAGFERYFAELSDLIGAEGTPPDPAKVGPIARAHQLETDPSSIARLCSEHGLWF